MRKRYQFLCVGLLVLLMAGASFAQRPRSVNDQPSSDENAAQSLPPAPSNVKAKYEGGVFGYEKKQDGTLVFDDQSGRLIFRDKYQKEVLSIPYASIVSAYGSKQSRQPAAATVVGAIPVLYTLPARFIKKKYQYLTLQYKDPDTDASGVTSFKLQNKEILASVLATLAGKA